MMTLIVWIGGTTAFAIALCFIGMGLHGLFLEIDEWGWRWGVGDGATTLIGLMVSVAALGAGLMGAIVLIGLAFGMIPLPADLRAG